MLVRFAILCLFVLATACLPAQSPSTSSIGLSVAYVGYTGAPGSSPFELHLDITPLGDDYYRRLERIRITGFPNLPWLQGTSITVTYLDSLGRNASIDFVY